MRGTVLMHLLDRRRVGAVGCGGASELSELKPGNIFGCGTMCH